MGTTFDLLAIRICLMHFELTLPLWPAPLQILTIGLFTYYTVVTVNKVWVFCCELICNS